MEKICENCEEVFVAKNTRQRFCTRGCARAFNSKRNGVTIQCAYCGEDKRIGVSQLANKNFCNAECRKKYEEEARYNKAKNYIEVESNSGCTLLSTEYKNKRAKLKIRCRCGTDFERALEDFQYSTTKGCNFCAGIAVRNKTCPVCEKEFKPVKKTQVCCSKSCAQTFRNPPIYISCCICNVKVKKTQCQIDRSERHYCSKECYSKGMSIFLIRENNPNYKGKSYLGECSYCGDDIIINEYDKRRTSKYHYCSISCKGEHQKEILLGENNPKYRSIKCSCSFCGKVLYRTPNYINSRINIYCSQECKADWQSKFLSGENNPNYNPTISPADREIGRNFDGYAYWRREVFKRDNYTCQCCGDDKGGNINAHHKDGYHWAKDRRVEIDNGVTLCEICHNKFHSIYGNRFNTEAQFNNFLKMYGTYNKSID